MLTGNVLGHVTPAAPHVQPHCAAGASGSEKACSASAVKSPPHGGAVPAPDARAAGPFQSGGASKQAHEPPSGNCTIFTSGAEDASVAPQSASHDVASLPPLRPSTL